jgi:hypothetical protein
MKNLISLFVLPLLIGLSSQLNAQIYADEVQVVEGLGGKVGVGITPESNLDILIQGDTNAGRKLRSYDGGGVRFQRFGDTSGSSMQYGFLSNDGLTDWGGFGGYLGGSGLNYFFVGDDYQTPIAAFLPGGNVGIGTTSPGAKLVVYSGAVHPAKTYSIANGEGLLLDAYYTGDANFTRYSDIVASSSDWTPSIMRFFTKAPYGTHAERLRISSDGKIGIGDSNPVSRLSVNGDIVISNASLPMGLMTEVGGTTPLLNLSLNFREPNKNNAYPGASFRIDSRPGVPLFQWLGRAANDSYEPLLMSIMGNGNVGIGMQPNSNKLAVNGEASKTNPGSWAGNSDARLKKNITQLKPEETLTKLLQLQGVTYEWDDDKTGINRPEGLQYGFSAQNIRSVFPELVEEDNLGYLQTAYGTYDAMMIEALRALNEKIEKLETENEGLKQSVVDLKKSDESQQASISSLQKQLQELSSMMITLSAKELSSSKTTQQ